MKKLASIAATLVIGLTFQAGIVQAGSSEIMSFGYMNPFGARQTEEMKVALKLWTKEIYNSGASSTQLQAVLLANLEDVTFQLKLKKLQVVALSTDYFLKLSPQFDLIPMAVPVMGDTVGDQYIFLTRKDSGYKKIDDFKGKTIITNDNDLKESTPTMWLEILLQQRGLATASSFFGRIISETTPNKIILPVFFKNADGCVVSKRTFDTLKELNPQIGREMSILETSPLLLEWLLFFTDQAPLETRKAMLNNILNLHNTPRGQQILTLFQIKKFIPYRPGHIESFRSLFKDYAGLPG